MTSSMPEVSESFGWILLAPWQIRWQ